MRVESRAVVPGDRLPELSPAAVALSLHSVVAAAALWGLYGGAWLSIAANRLLPGESVASSAVLGAWAHVAGFCIALAVCLGSLPRAGVRGRGAGLGLLLMMMIMILVVTGGGAGEPIAGRPAAARAMVGASFWIALSSLAVLALDF